MKQLTTDVLIVGGGPAGAAAAISLLTYGKDISVTIIEQSDLGTRRVGEHVSAGIFGLLDYLQLKWEDFGPDCFVPTYGNTSYWGIDQPILRDSIFTTEAASYQLDRMQFDLTLLEHVAELGGQVFPRTKCTQFTQLEHMQWKVDLKHPTTGTFDITARFLIDASGRQASVCRQIGVDNKKADQLMGVGAFLQFGDGRALAHNVVLETVENGWWYSAILSQDTMTVVFFSDADLISKHGYHKTDNWNQLLQETKQVKQLVKGAHAHEGVWIRNAHTQMSRSPGCKAFLAIGDAAVSFDPISSMGIGFAITSACQAAAIVQAELSAPDPQRIAVYQADLERHFTQYQTLRKKIYREERRWPLSAFWQRRQGQVQVGALSL